MKKIIFSLFLSIYSINCFAENNSQKFYFGAELGYTKPENNTEWIENYLTQNLGGNHQAKQDNYISDLRFFGGFKVDQYLDLELGISATDDFKISINGIGNNKKSYYAAYTSSYSGLDLSAILRPFDESKLKNLYFRVGGTNLKTKEQLTITTSGSNNYYSANYETIGNGYILGIGYDYPISESKFVRASWNHLGNISGISGNYVNKISLGFLGKF